MIAGQRLLLFHSSFTCVYLPGILILLKYNENLYNVGSYKFIPILLALVFAEVIKLIFSMFYNERNNYNRIDPRLLPRSRKPWSRFIKEIIKFMIFMLILSTIYYIIIILFGAPLTIKREETTMLAITLTTLTYVATSLHLGVDTTIAILTKLQCSNCDPLAEAMSLNIKATFLGTWLGAIVIPLDWDRPWQEWPIPCVIGALIGYMAAHFITLIKVLPIGKFIKNHFLVKKLHR